ncbi:LD-carboxypeptidase [Glaciimonas sp. GG7]
MSSALAKSYQKVALVASSTQYDEQIVEKVKGALTLNGYSVDTRHLNQVVSDFGYVNTDRSRAKMLIDAMLDDQVEIVWFIKGGGGAFNLLPFLYAAKEQLALAKPKVLVGFSDVTAIHGFVNEYLQWPSVHGTVASLNKEMTAPDGKIKTNDLEPIAAINALFNVGVNYQNVLPLNDAAKKGIQGQLRGGNFTLVSSAFSTRYEPDFSGKVLLLEDVGVSFRQLDRSLHQLLFKKDLHVDAIIFGQLYPLDPTDAERLMYKSVIENFAKKFNKPVYYYPFIGHGRTNHPVILGADVLLSCPENVEYCSLQQKL